MRDNNTWPMPLTAQLSDTVHAIEIEWLAATGPYQNNGRLALRVDGTQIGQRTGVDNDTHRIDMARLGTVTAPSGVSGMYCFDAFASRRSGTIGLESGAHGCGGIGIGAEGFGEVSSLADALPFVEITGTAPITGNNVAPTATLTVTDNGGATAASSGMGRASPRRRPTATVSAKHAAKPPIIRKAATSHDAVPAKDTASKATTKPGMT